MKILLSSALLCISSVVFADSNQLNPHTKEALIKALRANPVVAAAVFQAKKSGTPVCTYEISQTFPIQNMQNTYDYAARVICNSKNMDEMGAGQTLIDIKGSWTTGEPIIELDLSVSIAG